VFCAVVMISLVACGARATQQPSPDDAEARLVAIERDPLAIVRRATLPTYKATYVMRFTTSLPLATASPLPAFAITQTYASRPPDSRWDTLVDLPASSTTGPAPSRVVGIVKGSAGYICIDVPAPAACYAVPADQTRSFDVRSLEAALDEVKGLGSEVDTLALPRERIAGRDGACVRFTPKAAAAPTPLFGALAEAFAVEMCFTAEGIPLRMGWSAGGLMAIEQRATSVSDSVSDADLALPYPVSAGPLPFGDATPGATARPSATR
jgi:hypothetical protein